MSWVANAIEAVDVGVVALFGLLIVALVACATAAGIAGLDRMRRVLAIVGVLAFAGAMTAFWLEGGYTSAVQRPLVPFFLLLVALVVWAVLTGDFWHVSQWLVLGAGALMVASGWLSLFPPLQAHLDPVAGNALWVGGMPATLYGQRLTGAFLRSREPGADSFWRLSRLTREDYALILFFLLLLAIPVLSDSHVLGRYPWLIYALLALIPAPLVIAPIMKHRLWHPSQWWQPDRWSSSDLFMVVFCLVLVAVPVIGELAGYNSWLTFAFNPWLMFAFAALLVASVAIDLILRNRLWHPSRWSAYRVGLLAVAGSLVIGGIAGEAGQTAGVLLFLAGLVTTLFGNLRHPAQWLAAGTGVAAMASVVFIPLDNGGGYSFLAGALIVLFAPRLMGSRLEVRRKAREEAKAV